MESMLDTRCRILDAAVSIVDYQGSSIQYPASSIQYLYIMVTVLITGGTGLIGTALTRSLLAKNYKVITLSREPEKHRPGMANLSYARWNVDAQTIDVDAIANADYIIHLAGAGVADRRWTEKRKQKIVNSRVRGGALITKALAEHHNHVRAVLSSSGIGWYGPDPSVPNPHPFTENDPAYNDFLGTTCLQWENSLEPIKALGKRLIKFRTGIVLSREGGALPEFLRSLRFRIAAILGSGKQIISWIHIDDLVNLYIEAIENEKMNGIYNAVSPNPVSNKTLMLELAKKKRGQLFLPVHVPAFALKLALGEMSIEVLKSATVSSGKIENTGFNFAYPTIEEAIKNLVGKK
ncbi:MAG TPA: TIGR01777 family oxidoreductase [Chitinophagaceae bacterium]|nr:TIGR01777 family oxidoreductase [Chitinophagaceae bacterium]